MEPEPRRAADVPASPESGRALVQPDRDEPTMTPIQPAAAVVPASDAGDLGTRRRFLVWLGGLSVVSTIAMVATPIAGFLVPPQTGRTAGGGKVLVAKTEDLPPGVGKVVAMGSAPAIVVNTEQGVRAYSAICTHLGCVVAWNDLANVIQCPCHDGRFNPVSGTVISGPPPSPLPPIDVSIDGDEIFLVEG